MAAIPSDLKKKAPMTEKTELSNTTMVPGTLTDLASMRCKHYYKIINESNIIEPSCIKKWKPIYPEGCKRVQRMCLSDNHLFIVHNSGLSKFSMREGAMNGSVLQNGSVACSSVHSVAPLPDGSIVFTDQDSRQAKELRKCGTVAVIAGTGEESNKNGSGSHAAYGRMYIREQCICQR